MLLTYSYQYLSLGGGGGGVEERAKVKPSQSNQLEWNLDGLGLCLAIPDLTNAQVYKCRALINQVKGYNPTEKFI